VTAASGLLAPGNGNKTSPTAEQDGKGGEKRKKKKEKRERKEKQSPFV